ncbi:MAG: DUF1127 domain-containing protein [Roseobacter sp.]
MAYHDTHHSPIGEGLRTVGTAIAQVFARIGSALVSAAEANHRIKTVERLQAKSDAELAALNLRREDIVRHVFRDVFFN